MTCVSHTLRWRATGHTLIILPADEWHECNRHLKFYIAMFSARCLSISKNGKSPLLLHLDVQNSGDIMVPGSAQLVVLNVLKTLEQPEVLSGGEQRSVRQPALCQLQFDQLVQDRVWSGHVGCEEDFTAEEVSKLFRLAMQAIC